MELEIVETQSWRYKTTAVIKRQQQTTISNKQKQATVFTQQVCKTYIKYSKKILRQAMQNQCLLKLSQKVLNVKSFCSS